MKQTFIMYPPVYHAYIEKRGMRTRKERSGGRRRQSRRRGRRRRRQRRRMPMTGWQS